MSTWENLTNGQNTETTLVEMKCFIVMAEQRRRFFVQICSEWHCIKTASPRQNIMQNDEVSHRVDDLDASLRDVKKDVDRMKELFRIYDKETSFNDTSEETKKNRIRSLC